MSRRRIYPLVLHKSEWERLKKQSGPLEPDTTLFNSREEYYKALNEQSREWMKTWPDSAEGVKEKLRKQRRQQHKEDLALIDAFRKSRKYDNTPAVNRAKQLIFDDSCYGRQLISAMLESKAIEEREAQIKFQKEMKLKEAEKRKNQTNPISPFIPLEDKDRQKRAKRAALDCVKINQELELMKKEKKAQLKSEQIECEVVNHDMIKKMQDAEANKQAEIKRLVNEDIEEYAAEKREIERRRKMIEDRDNALIEVYKKEQDTIKCKVDAIMKKIIDEKRDGKQAMEYYKMIDEIKKTEKKRYDDFIEKGVKMMDERNEMQLKKDIEMEKKNHENLRKIAVENKITGENHKLCLQLTAPRNKCVCDVQTLLTNPEADKALKKIDGETKAGKTNKYEEESHNQKVEDDHKQENKQQKEVARKSAEKFPFLKPRNELVQALKRREKEPSGWTGADKTDEYFARRASSALRQSKHKHFAKKVVDEYRKCNNLDATSTSLPVPDE